MTIETPMTSTPSSHPGRGVPALLRGLLYPLRGIRWLATHRGAWPYALLPAAVNALLLGLFGFLAWNQYDALFAAIQPDSLAVAPVDPAWWQKIVLPLGNGLVTFVTTLLLVAAAVLGGLLGGAVLAGPFHEKLSEVVESIATGHPAPDEPLTLANLSRDGVRAVTSAVQRLVLFGIIYVPLLLLSLIPFVGLVGLAGTLVYSAFFLALNFTDPVLERRKLPLRAKLRWARASLFPWLGFGAGLMGISLIPLVGLVLAPAFVTAGTLLYLDVESDPET